MFYHISVQKNLDIFVSVIPAVLFSKNYFQKTRLLGHVTFTCLTPSLTVLLFMIVTHSYHMEIPFAPFPAIGLVDSIYLLTMSETKPIALVHALHFQSKINNQNTRPQQDLINVMLNFKPVLSGNSN